MKINTCTQKMYYHAAITLIPGHLYRSVHEYYFYTVL